MCADCCVCLCLVEDVCVFLSFYRLNEISRYGRVCLRVAAYG